MSGSLSLLDTIPLHDLSVPINPNVPGPARLGLSVQDGRVGDVVVLKHTLFKLTLGREVFLKDTERETHTQQVRSIIYIFTLQFYWLRWERDEMSLTFHCDRVTGASLASHAHTLSHKTNSFQHVLMSMCHMDKMLPSQDTITYHLCLPVTSHNQPDPSPLPQFNSPAVGLQLIHRNTYTHSFALGDTSTPGHPTLLHHTLITAHAVSPAHILPLQRVIPSTPPSFGNLVREQTNLQDWFGALMWQVSWKGLNKEFALSLSTSLIHFPLSRPLSSRCSPCSVYLSP